ncbi:phage tail assembly protein [Agrobacterium tumefaciens]|uniref:phage tail assembly protein n=1 Tax=Agrobacterium tumefaciens TaxID=358 RepID=UPI000EBA497F|nr:phage tail assembly protein [Agrobacterium tumefaciens]MCW8059310.1 phage tail assembly protein [Agrobacterium tumefaciens]MCW8147116.1 phage tail assembly protein [Agrobacterium tumefaciens]HCV74011.1 phage tail assembly protein [Agrobacterium sp.]
MTDTNAATDNETVVVTLSKPVTHGEDRYPVLTFREPTVGDLIVGDQFPGQLAKMTAILASISDTPLPAFKKIGAKDFSKIVTATSGLLGNEKKKDTTGG